MPILGDSNNRQMETKRSLKFKFYRKEISYFYHRKIGPLVAYIIG